MYRLIGLDLDGTLLNKNKEITPRTLKAIQMAQAKGVRIVLASGRPIGGMRPYLETLSLTTEQDFVVYFNGSMVANVATGEIIHQHVIDAPAVKSIAALAKTFDTHVHAFSQELGLMTPKINRYTELESHINNLHIHEMDFDTLADDHPMIKVMMVDEPEKLQWILDQLPQEMHAHYSIVRSAPFFLEFLHPLSNKGLGIQVIAERAGITADEIICMGDAENDHHMIQYAGLGVAMKNAMPQTQAIADLITDSNQEDAVAKVIEQYVL